MAGSKEKISAGGVVAMVIVIVIVSIQNRGKQAATSTPAPAPIASSASAPPADSSSPTLEKASVPTPAGREVRIGTWNIEWLGRPAERSGVARGVEQSAQDLADYLAFSRVDVLALQEIIADASAGVGPGRTPRSARLDAMIDASSSSGRRWEYVLFPGRRDDDQLTGVMWDTNVVTPLDQRGETWDAKDEPKLLNVRTGRSAQGSGLWNRRPHAMRLRLGPDMTDLALIPVHMKADYDGAFAEHRAQEMRALVEVLPGFEREWSERDIVILGDTNVTERGEAAIRAIVEAGFLDCNQAELQTNWREGAMDRAFLPEGQPEFASPACEVISDAYLRARGWQPRDFKRALSDHYMVVTTVRVMPDDD